MNWVKITKMAFKRSAVENSTRLALHSYIRKNTAFTIQTSALEMIAYREVSGLC